MQTSQRGTQAVPAADACPSALTTLDLVGGTSTLTQTWRSESLPAINLHKPNYPRPPAHPVTT